MYKTLFIIFLCLAGIANGEPEEVDLGEYRVYFDLGVNRSEYEIKVLDPVYSETLGGDETKEWTVYIREKGNYDFGYSVAAIVIDSFKGIKMINQEELIEKIYDFFNAEHEVYDVYADHRTIDGKEGVIAKAKLGYKDSNLYEILIPTYFATYAASDDTAVSIFSIYGWDSGTLSLLKSLRVEEKE